MDAKAERSDQSLAHAAFAELKRRILTCELQPGALINAPKLALSLSVSPSPVHEALKQLCAEGLAEVIPRVGYRVSKVTVEDVQEIFQLRIVNESHAVEAAIARASDDELERFVEQAEWSAIHGVGEGDSADRLDPLDSYAGAIRHNDFHLRVATLSGNRRLVQLISGLLDQSQRMMVAQNAYQRSRMQWTHMSMGRGHRAVVDALIARDRKASIAAMAGHIAEGRQRVLEALFPAPLEYNDPPNLDS